MNFLLLINFLLVFNFFKILQTQQLCGKQKTLSKIYGNDEAILGEFPWLGLIFYTRLNKSHCQGFLINNRVVLTAAHCLESSFFNKYGIPYV